MQWNYKFLIINNYNYYTIVVNMKWRFFKIKLIFFNSDGHNEYKYLYILKYQKIKPIIKFLLQ